jgi:hypothetical protein
MEVFIFKYHFDLLSVIRGIWVAAGGWAPVLISPMAGVLEKEPYIFLYLSLCHRLYPPRLWLKEVYKEKTNKRSYVVL